MAWVKLDDSMPMHPKLLAAGVEAFALDVAALAYCNRYQTDGAVATMSLRAVLPSLPDPEAAAARLVEVGRWDKTEDGWLIHDYLEYQPSKEHQQDVSAKRAEAGRIGGKAPRSPSPKAKGKQNAFAPSNPDPSRPDPSLTAAATLDAFNRERAAAAVKERRKQGLLVKSDGGLARSIAADPEHLAESKRLWAHRECTKCKGKGSTEAYAPGAGTRLIPCEEPA